MEEENDFGIEEKIANIKETLHRLGSSFTKDQSEYQTYVVKPTESSGSSEAFESYFDSKADDTYLRGSYSVGDIKPDDSYENSQMFISPRFPTEDLPRAAYVSDYVIYGQNENDSPEQKQHAGQVHS
jgi:hypothetical protein